MAGYQGDAHELVNRQLVPEATQRQVLLATVLEEMAEKDSGLQEVIEAIPVEVWELLHHPEQYTGLAKEKALEVAAYARERAGEPNP
jgi:adenylosuccinate lyase